MTGVAITEFRNHIIDSGSVLDPTGTHHEFRDGMHGQKLDFDKLVTGESLYDEWISVAEDFIRMKFPRLPEVIVGVANGTNRVALDVARRFRGEVRGAESEKDETDSKILHLGEITTRLIVALKPELVVVLEDVGTTGSNSVQVAMQCQDAGAEQVEVVNTWQRRFQLEKLEEAGIPYHAIINEILPTFSEDDCRKDILGFCARDWEFIPRPR